MQACVIGVDLGGTNVRAGAYAVDGSPAGASVSLPSNAQQGTQQIFDAIVSAITQARDRAEGRVLAVGLAVPGHVDDENGVVRWAPNLGEEVHGVFHYWKDVFLRGPIERRVNLPLRMANDANAAALGEYRAGLGRNNAKCLVMLTLGTGIGGGVVMSPSAVHGHAGGPLILLGGNKGGAELGHMIVLAGGIDANSGEYGALEGYCRRDAIVMRAVHRLNRGRVSAILGLVGGDVAKVTPRIIAEAADEGDELAQEVLRETGEYLGVAIGSLINIFAPDVVAIGGQIAKAGEHILRPARATAQNTAIPSLFEDATISRAELLEDAGMIGAAVLASEWIRWTTTSD